MHSSELFEQGWDISGRGTLIYKFTPEMEQILHTSLYNAIDAEMKKIF
jgi:hypothetical protein